MFQNYFAKIRFQTVYVSPQLASGNKTRQQEIVQTNQSLRREHGLMQQEFVKNAKSQQQSKDTKDPQDDDAMSEDSFVQIPPTPNDPGMLNVFCEFCFSQKF